MTAQSGYTEYISTYDTDLGFTPNSAVNSVAAILSTPTPFKNISSNSFFQLGDTVLLRSIYIAIPYQWGAGELGPINVAFGWRDKAAHSGILEVFSGTNRGNIPQVEVEFPLETIIDTPPTATTEWEMMLNIFSGLSVNMINSPAALDTIVQYPRVNMGVRHSLTMIP